MSMPEVSARSKLSESARIRLPSSVYLSISPTASMTDEADDDHDQLGAPDAQAEELDRSATLSRRGRGPRCPR